mmetsp:Transcript_25629/g.37475  ORF Transcript_25629/g.37475 Transcript_25629/m.37475 type:complete len:205 (+) Transcript_25629:585-1199(+)
MPVVHAIHSRPLRPRIIRGPFHGRLWHEFEVRNRLASVSHRCTDAIRSCITTTDYNHVLSGGSYEVVFFPSGLECSFLGHKQPLLILRQEFHCKMDSLQLSTRDRQVTRLGGTKAQDKSIHVCTEFIYVNVLPNVCTRDKLDPFLAEEIDTTFDGLLLQFHIWNSIHEKSTNPILAFINRNLVAHLVQLIRSRKSSRTRSNHSN